MQYTENYQFRKPIIGVDDADVKDINFNSDRADTLIHNTQISLAPAYDLNETYNTGDVVMYETLMYKCKEDNVTGAWNASKWERTTAGEEGAGGGGSSVVPNPQGEPTDTLRTIGIDGTIFDIAGSGGGGGGSAYEETTLWSGSDSASMTLSESFEDYDAIMVVAKTSYNNTEYSMSAVWLTSYLSDHINDGMRFGLTGDSWYIYFSITDNTTFVRQDQYSLYISEVKGLKLRGGAGDASEIIPISAGDGTLSRTFTFDKTPKFIKFHWEDAVLDSGWVLDFDIVWGQTYCANVAHRRNVDVANIAGGSVSLSYSLDGKAVTITAGNAFQACNTSNGTGSMFIDYGGGSGGSAVKDVLYSDANGAPQLTWLTLTHSINDYDVIYMKISNPTDIGNFNIYTYHSFMPMMYDPTERVSIQGLYGQRVVDVAFNGASFNITRTDGDFRNNTIYEIVGIKY